MSFCLCTHPKGNVAALRAAAGVVVFGLAAVLHAAPVVTAILPAPGSTVSALTNVSVTFSEPVTGLNASDLGVNGEVITSVTGSGAGPYVFTFPQPPAGEVTLGWDVDQSISGIGTGVLENPSGWSYTLTDTIAPAFGKVRTSVAGQEMDDVRPAPGSTVNVVTAAIITFSEPVTGVNAADLLVNGVPAASVTGDSAGPYTFSFPDPDPGSAVNFTWAAGHGIQDLSGNGFGGTGWSTLRDTAAPQVQITEFLAANGGTAVMAGSDTDGTRDENWDLSPWIELYNAGGAPVNLLGWSLTDDLTHPAQWVLPARTLPAGGRLLVFASGKDRKPASGNLHANFSLSENGGTLALFGPEPQAAAVSSWANYPPQRYDYSYGAREPDGLARYFSPPTVSQGAYTLPSSDIGGTAGTVPPAPAGGANGSSSLTGLTPEAHASVERGFFDEPFNTVLSCPDSTAVIRYTLDGSPPLVTSAAYAGPLTISGTTVLRMAAFGTDRVPSRTVTHTYLFASQVVNQPSPPYDNPALTTDNGNPQPPSPGGSPLPIAWGTSGTFTAAQTLPGFPTGTGTGSNNLTAGQIPADYGMDPKVWADPTRYSDSGAVDAVNGRTNLERINNCLRTQPALSLVMKSTDMFGAYPNGTIPAGTVDPLYPTSSSTIKRDMTKPCSLELLQPDGTTVFVTDCGIDLHGNASRDPFKNPKHGFTLRFKGRYGAGKVTGKIFPDSPVRDWDKLVLRGDFGGSWLHQNGQDLIAAGSDNYQRPRGIRIREAFCKDSFRDMGRVASHNRFCNLFINGVCWGSYELMEDEAEDFGAAYMGGNKDDFDVVDQGKLKSGTWNVWSSIKTLLGWTGGTPTTDNTTPPANYLNTLTNTQYETLRTLLDLPWFQDYMIWQTWAGHRDWATDASDAGKYMKNVYFIRPRGGKFRAMPWDMENLLWSETEDRITGMTTFATTPSLFPPAVIHPRAKTNAEYRLEFADRAWRHLVRPGGALTPAANIARMNKWVSVFGVDSAVLESARWGDYRYKVHAYTLGTVNQVYTWNGAWYDNSTTAQYNGSWSAGLQRFNTGRSSAAQLGSYTTSMSNSWLDEVRRLNTVYFPARTANVLTQYRNNGLYPLLNAPELHHNGTDANLGDTQLASGTQVKLVMPASAGTGSNLADIYYTTDGTDPRAAYDFAGTPRAGALLYGTPLTVTGPVTIKARALAKPGSFPAKPPVRAASTAALTVTYNSVGGSSARGQITAAPLTLDGLTLNANDRILLKNQATAAQNGIWVVTTPGTGATGVWDRATDWDADGEVVPNTWVRVTSGTQNADSQWRVTNAGGLIVGGVGGTAVTFSTNGFSPWSALLEVRLTSGPPAPTVCFSEIHYNPRGSQGGTAAEFVELWNYGTQPVDMTSWSTGGISFVFPAGFVLEPGQRTVLASNNNPVTFAAQYPGLIPLGYFSGTLDNGGERLSLLDALGNVVCTVEYNNNQPWPVAADNGGYSLELIDPRGDLQSAANWKASAALKGSPGAANSPPVPAAVGISEFFAAGGAGSVNGSPQADFVEIENTGGSPVDLTGWKLNDWPVPAVTLAPGARVSLPPPAGTVWAAASGAFVLQNSVGGVVDGVRYGPQVVTRSFIRSSGAWVPGMPTPGAANQAAPSASGPARINEILANPSPGSDDWLELHNPDGAAVLNLTGCWLEREGTVFRFSAPAALAPGGYARFYCDAGGSAGDRITFNLPATGAALILRDAAWNLWDTLTYSAQSGDVSQGRLPDGTGALTTLIYPSPGLTNSNTLSGVQLNEVLVINREGDNAPWGRRPAWVELVRGSGPAISLQGWSLRTRSTAPAVWTFPAGVTLSPGQPLAVWCDAAAPASTAAALQMNAALPLDDSLVHWGLELRDASGLIQDAVTWGRQISDRSIGRLPDSSWALLTSPTRGAANSAAAPLAAAAGVKINEWYLSVPSQPLLYSFIELYNPAPLPAPLGGLWLGDEPSETGRRKWRIPDLTFVAGQGFALFNTGSGTSQPSVFLFDLAAAGEYLRLSQNDSSTTAVDALSFGPSAPDQSQGRLPDGSAATGGMVPSPGASNTAVPAPAFITHPASTAAVAGGSVILSATPLNYLSLQWRKNGSPIPGAVDATLQLNSLTAGDEADYTLAATSAAGTAVSRPAHLTVLYTWQAWAAQYGLTSLSGDNDADGMDNATEFLSGGNPLAAGSLAGGIAGGSDTLSGQRYFTLDYTLSRRAAFSSLTGQRSNNLTLWSDESPAGSEILSTQPNGDTRLRVRFPWAAGSGREFLRLKLTP